MQRRFDLVLWMTMALGACGGGKSDTETGPPPEDTAETPAPTEEPTPPEPAEPTTPEPAGPTAFEQQAGEGEKLYGEHCASCHGAAGEGVKAPKVVGLKEGALPLDPPKGAKLRKTKFKTVADIADFVVKNMPLKKAGSLSNDQYLAILAFDLKANGIDLKDKKLDMELAKTLEIPR